MNLKLNLGAVVLSLAVKALAANAPAIIPQPAHLEAKPGTFALTTKTEITFGGGEAEAKKLAALLRTATGFKLPVSPVSTLAKSSEIVLLLQTNRLDKFGAEGYALTVAPNSFGITAATEAGLFYGGRTLLQLLPPEIFSTNAVKHFNWQIPCVTITDQPRFAWRGLMLDCSRTFQSVEYLHKTIDRMADYKLNVLHLHLTDDQGWRLEIKKHPELTQQGAFFSAKYDEPPSHQGFYTQAQMREVVAYAAARHITIVPEIEMPGHSHEVVVCRPDLSCAGISTNDIFPFYKGPTTTADIYCAGNEDTFQFLQDVLDEVTEIFTSKFIHVGGDEVPKGAWKSCPKCQAIMKAEGLQNEHELQSYFIRRMEKYLAGKGRRLIGWDEILEGGFAPNATVMSWRGTSGGLAAATAGHDVVMSPTSHCYFDYSYDTINSERVFAFDPAAGLPPKAVPQVLGLQANFWSHIDREPKLVDRQLFPRLLAIAERGWSPDNRSEWPDYQRRAQAQLAWLEQLGVHYQPLVLAAPIGEWNPESFAGGATSLEFDVTPQITGPGDYLMKPVYTKGVYGVNLHAAELIGQVGTGDRHEGFAGSRPTNETFELRVPSAPANRSFRLRLTLDPAGGTNTWGKVYLIPAMSK
jgi:hexosaminidase